MGEKTVTLTEAELKKVVYDSVMAAMTLLGVDTKEPTEMQRDFSHLRDWRVATQNIQKKGFGAVIVMIITGLGGLIWLGFRTAFNN